MMLFQKVHLWVFCLVSETKKHAYYGALLILRHELYNSTLGTLQQNNGFILVQLHFMLSALNVHLCLGALTPNKNILKRRQPCEITLDLNFCEDSESRASVISVKKSLNSKGGHVTCSVSKQFCWVMYKPGFLYPASVIGIFVHLFFIQISLDTRCPSLEIVKQWSLCRCCIL